VSRDDDTRPVMCEEPFVGPCVLWRRWREQPGGDELLCAVMETGPTVFRLALLLGACRPPRDWRVIQSGTGSLDECVARGGRLGEVLAHFRPVLVCDDALPPKDIVEICSLMRTVQLGGGRAVDETLRGRRRVQTSALGPCLARQAVEGRGGSR
jgi:hypothetical protein